MKSYAFIRYCSSSWERWAGSKGLYWGGLHPSRKASLSLPSPRAVTDYSSATGPRCGFCAHWSCWICVPPPDEPVKATQALKESLQTATSSNHPSSQAITNVNQGSDKTSLWIMNSSITWAKQIVVNKYFEVLVAIQSGSLRWRHERSTALFSLTAKSSWSLCRC